MSRENFSSGSDWEPIIGYSRAVKVGDYLHISGTTASGEDGALVGVGDAYAQTIQCLTNIKAVLERAGGEMEDIVRTRMFVTDMANWQIIGKAHGEFFADIRPATTIVEVSKLIAPDLLVEIEADAYIGS